LPDHLHSRLREQSEQTGRSLNQTIVSALRATLDETSVGTPQSPLKEQLRQVRAVLGDLVVDFDVGRLLAELDSKDRDTEDGETTRPLPALNPPLSATVIEDREDRV
jgi:hypothetical protein